MGSTIYNGLGYGVHIADSANITIRNSVVFSFKKRGINIEKSESIKLDGNHVSHVTDRSIKFTDMLYEATGCVVACENVADKCKDIQITNNVASGCVYAGFVVYGHKCGDYSTSTFRDNVAHSVEHAGAAIFPDPSSPDQKECMEGSRFTAYKCGLYGALSYFDTKKTIHSNMTLIDNGYGSTIHIG